MSQHKYSKLVATLAIALVAGCKTDPQPIVFPSMESISKVPAVQDSPHSAPALVPDGRDSNSSQGRQHDERVGLTGPEKYPFVSPTYDELAQWVNLRTGQITDLWARATFQLTSVDAGGKLQQETGEGFLMIRRPSKTAIICTHALQSYTSWAGCDESKYWYFSKLDSTCCVGTNSNVKNPCTEQLAVPLHPLAFVDLAGMFIFPAMQVPPQVSLTTIPLPGRDPIAAWSFTLERPDYPIRISLDPQTWLPIRVELLNVTDRKSVLISELSDYVAVVFPSSTGVFEFQMPRRIRLTAPSLERGELIIEPAQIASTPPDQTTLNRTLFEFNRVDLTMRPQRFIVLDRKCDSPAISPEIVAKLEAERATQKPIAK